MASQSIIKDTFYKSRLLKSGMNSFHQTKQGEKQLKGLTFQNIKQGLKDFRKTLVQSNYAFVTFQCNNLSIESIEAISQYTYLQNVDISYNNILNLDALSHLKYLMSLKASNNQLTKLLQLSSTPLGLESVDCSYNLIEQIPYLGVYSSFKILNLQNNKISKIEGLKNNLSLKILNLSENQIENIEGLDKLNLTQLYLAGNKINSLKGLTKLQRLRVLDISNNQIVKLEQIASLISLRTLHLSKNKVKHIRQIQQLQNLAYLQELDLCFNPVQQRRFYRLQVLYRLPMLGVLDGTVVSSIEVTKSEHLYGQDLSARAQIFKEILPDQQFIDRRVSISELIEVESDSDAERLGFVDKYDEQNNKIHPINRSKDRSMAASKGSAMSKYSKLSKESSFKI